MNCFNIRELQGMLKKKYFTDLINSNDHRDLLNDTMIGLRFKNNMNNAVEPNMISFYNYGTTFLNKTKSTSIESIYNTNSIQPMSNGSVLYTYLYSLILVVYQIFDNLFIEIFRSNEGKVANSFNTHYYNTLLSSEEVLFSFFNILRSFSIVSLSSIFNIVSMFKDVVSLNFG